MHLGNKIMNSSMVECVTITGGRDKSGSAECLPRIDVVAGQSLAVVGPTGSGKSELLSDIEQMAWEDTPSGRRVEIRRACGGADGDDGCPVARLSQKMSFLMDGTVERFLSLHAESRGRGEKDLVCETLKMANTLCGEPIAAGDSLQALSGGQSRALMIADIALISDAPVVLIDEIENAGIHKLRALSAIQDGGKPVVIATHDPLLILMADRRLVMKNGGMRRVLETSPAEKEILDSMRRVDSRVEALRSRLRSGETIDAALGVIA